MAILDLQAMELGPSSPNHHSWGGHCRGGGKKGGGGDGKSGLSLLKC